MTSEKQRNSKGKKWTRPVFPFCFIPCIASLILPILTLTSIPARIAAETVSSAYSAAPEAGSGRNINLQYAQASAAGLSVPATFTEPVIAAQFAVLMDSATGQILYKKNENGRAFPASITKIMTLLVAVEHAEADDIITMSHEAVYSIERDSSHIALQVGEEITMEQAFGALVLASANDAANGIAETVGGTLANFAKMMTDRAASIGAVNTQFTNAHGLPSDTHYSTAYDMALITREGLKNETFRKYFSLIEYTMAPTNLQPESRYFLTHHKMLYNTRYRYKDAFAGKTGYTSVAGSTLVTVAARDGHELICVTLKESAVEAYADAKILFDYGFSQFEPIMIPSSSYGGSTINVLQNSRKVGTAVFQNPADQTIWVPKGSGCTLSVVQMNQTDLDLPAASESAGSTGEGTATTTLHIRIPELSTPYYEASFTVPLEAVITLDPTPTPVPNADPDDAKRPVNTGLTILKFVGILLLVAVSAYILYVVFMIFKTGYYRKLWKKIRNGRKSQTGKNGHRAARTLDSRANPAHRPARRIRADQHSRETPGVRKINKPKDS